MPDSDEDQVRGGGNGSAANRVAFDYIKSQHFRVIRADGAIGSVTPNGHIHLAFYSERQAIPRRMVHELTSEGTLGQELDSETVARGSVVREMDVDLFITVDVAQGISDWLRQKIDEAQKRVREANPSGSMQ